MRGGVVQRKLGRDCRALCRKVNVNIIFARSAFADYVRLFVSLASRRATCSSGSANTTCRWRRNRTVTRNGESRLSLRIRSSTRGRSSTTWRCCGFTSPSSSSRISYPFACRTTSRISWARPRTSRDGDDCTKVRENGVGRRNGARRNALD